MFKPFRNKALSLASLAAVTTLLMGACPMDNILNVGQQPGAGKPATPTIQFVLPAARVDVQQGSIINLQWTDAHPAGAAIIRLFYDRDGVAGSGDSELTITTLTESAATTAGTYAWNTTGITPNVYRLAASIDDQVNPPVTIYLPYEVVVRSKTSTTPPTAGMNLQMLTPATALAPQTGEGVMISWKANDPSGQAVLYLYYDVDLNPVNDNKTLIAVVGSGTAEIGSNDYGWTIPAGINGLFHILGRLHNGVDPDVFAYALGTVQVGQITTSNSLRDLKDLGTIFAGAIFDGYVPYAHLGQVMTGGRDWNNDGYDDFVLVAPKSLSQGVSNDYTENGVTGVGEAYLVYSRGTSGRWFQGQSVSISNIATYALNGVRFVGPAFSSTTSGFSDVMFLDDVDGDTRPELVFGMSDINAVIYDDQDYDPLDSDAIHDPSNEKTLPGATKGRYYFQAPGWQEFSTPDDGFPYDVLRGGQMRSGLVAWVSSKSTIDDTTVWIDQVGVPSSQVWALPQAGWAYGMKLFPMAGGDNNSGWGAKLGSARLHGDLMPAVMVARPHHTTSTGAAEAGSIKVLPHNNMTEVTSVWTTFAPNLVNWSTPQPKCYTFPAAVRLLFNDGDDDRIPAWPHPWSWFMDPIVLDMSSLDWHLILQPPSPSNFDIVNQNVADATNGNLTNPTGLKDFDGDKTEDAAVASPGSLNNTGIAYVVYGNTSWFGADLSRFATASGTARGFELRGSQVGEQLGYQMIGPGNMTRDLAAGQSDWVLTAPHRNWAGRMNCGAVVLVPGQARLGSVSVDDVTTVLGGAIIYGGNSADQLGMYLSWAGDVDRDGYQDFLVSAPGYSDLVRGRSKCGAVYLVYGGPHLLGGEFDIRDIGSTNLPGKIYIGAENNAAIGPVSPAGDTDKDNFDDFLIAQPNFNAQGIAESGRVWLIYGGRRQAP